MRKINFLSDKKIVKDTSKSEPVAPIFLMMGEKRSTFTEFYRFNVIFLECKIILSIASM
jgi:hypothetical protein